MTMEGKKSQRKSRSDSVGLQRVRDQKKESLA
jgi:hypothetical protein